MNYLLDTNVVSEVMNDRANASVLAWVNHHEAYCFLSAVTVAEIDFGIELLPASRKKTQLTLVFERLLQNYKMRILPFDEIVARHWARLAANQKKRGRITPIQDSMIEATALYWGAVVATRNEKDFAEAVTFNPWQPGS